MKTLGSPQDNWLTRGIVWIGFAGLVYIPLFLHLDVNPLKTWDESLFALRAFSMAHYGEYLCSFQDLPGGFRSYNVKPPLITLMQAGLFRLIGYEQLALRLPIALTGAGIIGLFLWMSRHTSGDYRWGMWSGLMLVTMPGFIHEHMARTGDHDVPLSAFQLLMLWGAYLYTEGESSQRRGLWLMALGWLAALFTKSTLALIFLPSIFIYFLYRRKLLTLLRSKEAWMTLGVIAAVVAAYVIYIESACPGHFGHLNRQEGMGRFAESLGIHDHPWDFYINKWWDWRIAGWLYWLIPAFLITWIPQARPYRNILVLLWLSLVGGGVVISVSITKLEWYDASLLPLIAALIGFSVMALQRGLEAWLTPSTFVQRALIAVSFLFTLYLTPYLRIIDKVYMPQERQGPLENLGIMVEWMEEYDPHIKDFDILQRLDPSNVLFYQLVYNQTKNYNIRHLRRLRDIRPGDRLIICQPNLDDAFRGYFHHTIIRQYGTCSYYEVGPYTELALERLIPQLPFDTTACDTMVELP